MKTKLTAWVVLVCLLAQSAALAEEDKNSILGIWHVQVINTPNEKMIFGPEYARYLRFDQEGNMQTVNRVKVTQLLERESRYVHDQATASIAVFEIDEEGVVGDEPASKIRYRFVNGMLVFQLMKGQEQWRYELTREIDGTDRHKKLRKERGDKLGPGIEAAREVTRAKLSLSQLYSIYQASFIFAGVHDGVYPAGIGELVPGDYLIASMAISPWSDTDEPFDFDNWGDQRKIDWVNKNADYIYLLAGKKDMVPDDWVAAFELPRSDEQEEVRLVFGGGYVATKSFFAADKLIKKQTGHTLKEWMKTTSPGTGECILPEDDE